MGERVVVPGPRDVRGTLDVPGIQEGQRTPGGPDSRDGRRTGDGAVAACVVAAPPHPRHGGRRTDRRLRAVSDAITERGLACLRFDYGPWDEGRGERRDVADALEWASDRYDRVGLFGYSFGATVGLLAAQEAEPGAVCALAPDALAREALLGLTCPVQVVYGERDETVDWAPVVDGARERGHLVSGVPDDHWFATELDRVAALAGTFLAGVLRPSR